MLGAKELRKLRQILYARMPEKRWRMLLRDHDRVPANGGDFEEDLESDLSRARRAGCLHELIADAMDESLPVREAIRDARVECPAFEQFLKPPPVPPAAFDPVDVYDVYYFKRRPLINRANLRETFRALTDDGEDGARILLVQGEARSGKSYTVDFIESLAWHLGFRVRNIKLVEKTAGRELTPEILGAAIVEEMTLREEFQPVNHDQVSWWTSDFMSRLMRNLRDSEENWWIVIDDLHQVDLSPAVHEFVRQLASKIHHSLDCLRLVLIGYDDRRRLRELEPTIETDETEAITSEDLVDYFARFIRDHAPHVELTAAPQVIADAVQQVRTAMSEAEPRDVLLEMMSATARASRKLIRRS